MKSWVLLLFLLLLPGCVGPAEVPTSSSTQSPTSTRSNMLNVNVGNSPYNITANTFTSVMAQAISDVSAAGGGTITVPAPAGNVYYATDWLKIKSGVNIVFSDITTTVDMGLLPNNRWAMIVNDSLGMTLDHDISIYGGNFDMKWDGIGGTGHGGTKFVPKPPEATYRMGVQFVGVQNLTMEHVTISHPRNWGASFNRIFNGTFNEIMLNSYTSSSNYSNEGTFQFQGENAHIRVTNLRGTTNDDMLAFVNGWAMGPTVPGDGPMTDIIVDGVYMNTDGSSANGGLGNRIYETDPLNGVRIETCRQLMTDITIRNVFGRVREQIHEIGAQNYFDVYGNFGYGNIGTVTLENWTVASSLSSGRVSDPPTQIYPSLAYINGKIDTLIYRNFKVVSGPSNTPIIWLTPNLGGSSNSSMGNVKNLILDNFSTGYTASTPIIRCGSGATLQNLHVKNWGASSFNNIIYANDGGTTTNVNTYGFSWAGKVDGLANVTQLGAGDAFSYTSTSTHGVASLPQNLRYDSATNTLSWSAVPGATSYTVYHQYIYGLEASPFYTIASNGVISTTSGTSITLPAYTAGQWHIFSVKANNQTEPARGIWAQIGTASTIGENFAFIEQVNVNLSGSTYTVSGLRTDTALSVIPPTIPGASVSPVTYTGNNWSFTISGLADGLYRVPVWGIGVGGVVGPEPVTLSVGAGSPEYLVQPSTYDVSTASTTTSLAPTTTGAPTSTGGPTTTPAPGTTTPAPGTTTTTPSVTTSPGVSTTAPPFAAPTITGWGTGTGMISLNWDALTGATSYEIYYTSNGTDPSLINGLSVTGLTGNSYMFSGLPAGTYKMRMRAVYSGGVSTLGTVATILLTQGGTTTTTTTPPPTTTKTPTTTSTTTRTPTTTSVGPSTTGAPTTPQATTTPQPTTTSTTTTSTSTTTTTTTTTTPAPLPLIMSIRTSLGTFKARQTPGGALRIKTSMGVLTFGIFDTTGTIYINTSRGRYSLLTGRFEVKA